MEKKHIEAIVSKLSAVTFAMRVVGGIFRSPPDRTWGPTSLLYNGYQVAEFGKNRIKMISVFEQNESRICYVM